MNIDTSAWEVAETLPHGSLYWLEPGIVAAVPDDGVAESVELSQQVYDGYARCAEAYGRPVAIVVFVDRLSDQSAEVREFWSNVMHRDVLCVVALVCKSFFARAVAGVFMGIRKPVVPTRMFARVEQAVAWCQRRLAGAS